MHNLNIRLTKKYLLFYIDKLTMKVKISLDRSSFNGKNRTRAKLGVVPQSIEANFDYANS